MVPRKTRIVINPHMIVNFQFLIILCKRLALAVDMISFVLKLKIEGEEEEESSHILTVSKNTFSPSFHLPKLLTVLRHTFPRPLTFS